jgi:glycosyltransferase involved in cell wall biosynthesis
VNVSVLPLSRTRSRGPRVNLLSTCFQAEYEVGFARGLAANGLEVTVLGASASERERLESSIEFIDVRGSQDPRRSKLGKVMGILRYVGEYCLLGLRRRDELFHTNGLFVGRGGMPALVEAAVQRLAFRRWWLTVHNLVPHDRDSRFNRWVSRCIYRMPDRLWVHTAKMRDELVAGFGVRPERVSVLEHGIDQFVEVEAGAKERLAERFGTPAGARLMVQFGNISPYKGVDVFLDAIHRLPARGDVAFLVVGKCRDAALGERLRRAIGELQAAGHSVRWVDDYVSTADVRLLLSAADVLVMPYRHIDQSGVLFSAKSAGLPIVASDVGSFADYVTPGHDDLVPPGDVEALAGALRRHAERPPAPDRSAAVESARARYAWSNTLKDYAGQVRALFV